MGKSIPVVLNNGRVWKAKLEATNYFKDMLSRYVDGERVSEADSLNLSALLHRYDSCLESGQPIKAGVGVSHFTRELNRGEGWATSGFHVHRIDQSSVDFSYRDAIQQAPKDVGPG